jgi:hypothetical protein
LTNILKKDKIGFVSAKTSIIIITDGDSSIDTIATSIKASLTTFEVKICKADHFTGDELLPCETFFLGCVKPSPPSFAYLEEMLSHINFASRKCGVFSANEGALAYLQNILKDCEINIGKPLFVTGGKLNVTAVKNWAHEFMGL